jgi:hypothetical protein
MLSVVLVTTMLTQQPKRMVEVALKMLQVALVATKTVPRE